MIRIIHNCIFILVISAASISFTQSLPVYNVVKGDIQQSTGYYFLHSFKATSVVPGFKSLILDRYGEIVYIKSFNYTASDFKLHPNGKMSYIFSSSNPAALKYYIIDSTFFVKDSVNCPGGILTDGHDLILLPNGGYLLMGYETRVMNLSSYNWFNGNGSPGSSTANVKCNIIQELDANKNPVFTWKAADHYLFSDVQEAWLFSPTNVDWTHFNSIEKDSDGNYLVSVRHFSEVTKINRQTGAIMWRFGGKRNQFTFINDPYSGFNGQHDARRISNGNITLFDNGKTGAPQHPARGVEYNINEQNLTATLVWSRIYSNNSTSQFLGNTQRLANGNTIIGWGGLRNANVTFSAFKPDGNLVMEINFPDTLFTYRAFNYPSLPWQLNRPVITCRDSAGFHFLEAPTGHASYLWSTGSAARSIQVSVPDTYYVFVPYGQGGHISSERAIITNIGNPCSQVGIDPVTQNIPMSFMLEQNYPNPFNPMTNIRFQIPNTGFVKLVIYDVTGKEVETLVNEELNPGTYNVSWNALSYPSGVYFYTLSSDIFYQTRKMALIK